MGNKRIPLRKGLFVVNVWSADRRKAEWLDLFRLEVINCAALDEMGLILAEDDAATHDEHGEHDEGIALLVDGPAAVDDIERLGGELGYLIDVREAWAGWSGLDVDGTEVEVVS